MSAPMFSATSRTGPPISVAGGLLTPHTQVIRLSLPIMNWRLTWNRPTSVTFQPQDGPFQTLAIMDYTRLIQVSILALSLFAAMMIGRMNHD